MPQGDEPKRGESCKVETPTYTQFEYEVRTIKLKLPLHLKVNPFTYLKVNLKARAIRLNPYTQCGSEGESYKPKLLYTPR